MREIGVQFSEIPFAAWRASPRVMASPHVHTDIELNFLIAGSVTYFHAGKFYEVPPRRLAVFWGGMPHRLTTTAPGAEYFCMTLPLAWFLGWNLSGPLPSRLLTGELLVEPDETHAPTDFALMERWSTDLWRDGGSGAESRRIALLEVEARLRRMALEAGVGGRGSGFREGIKDNSSPPKPEARNPKPVLQGRQMERIADYIGRNYREEISLAGIAAAVNLHPNYAATAFREGSGLSVWEYVTRLRISHAQRLLLTTDWTAERIALDCGFHSPARFFAAFKRLCGVTPRQYRKR